MLSGDPAKDQKFLTQQFMAADENGDGVISFEEFKVRANDKTTQFFRN
jgi:Ca2+-binding EF-hand superfamily protein